jgi:hypothetical protein
MASTWSRLTIEGIVERAALKCSAMAPPMMTSLKLPMMDSSPHGAPASLSASSIKLQRSIIAMICWVNFVS